jgi:hypothetical protein
MLDKELQAYNDTLDDMEASIQKMRLASCSLSLKSLQETKAQIHGIKAKANKAQGSHTRLHHAYTLHLEQARDNQESTKPRKTESK